MEEEESTTQKLQNKVDKLKTMGLINSLHTLTPPNKNVEDRSLDIAFVNVLSSSRRIQDKFLTIRGLEWDAGKKQFIQVAPPIMNIEGAFRFCQLLKMAEEIEWASYAEEEIPQRETHFYNQNICSFLFWREVYDLNPKDDYYLCTTLQVFIDTSFHKAKSGKFINTLGRTFDEGVLKKALDTDGKGVSKKEEGFLSKMNPFKEMGK